MLLLKLRADAATDNACNILMGYNCTNAIGKAHKDTTAGTVRNRIDDKYIVNQLGNIIVTEIGYVTMALLAGYATYSKDLLIVPGVDEKNQFGYLVLRDKYMPYHSLAQDIDGAIAETQAAHKRATALLSYYGDLKSLKESAHSAPWYQLSTMEDAIDAGLCQWGTINFLERAKMGFIARRFGLPRCLVRFSGGFGTRVTASTNRRVAAIGTNRTQAAVQTEEPERRHA